MTTNKSNSNMTATDSLAAAKPININPLINKNKMRRSESFFRGFDGAQLFSQCWEVENPKGTILITHGQGEHSESYHRVLDFFKNDSWNFISWDLRGHGQSDGKRGYVLHFDDYCKDYEIFFDLALRKKVSGPLVTISHSMGGLIHLKTILNNQDMMQSLQAQCLSSPFLGLSLPIPVWKMKGSRFIYAIKPDLTLSNEIPNSALTRDPDIIREFQKDPHRHGRISSGAFLGSITSWDFVLKNAQKITLPTLVQMSDNDPVANTSAAKSFYEKMGSLNKKVYWYPNAKHELFNDINRNTVFQDLKLFLDSILKEKM